MTATRSSRFTTLRKSAFACTALALKPSLWRTRNCLSIGTAHLSAVLPARAAYSIGERMWTRPRHIQAELRRKQFEYEGEPCAVDNLYVFAHMCWRQGISSPREAAWRCWRATPSARHIWADKTAQKKNRPSCGWISANRKCIEAGTALNYKVNAKRRVSSPFWGILLVFFQCAILQRVLIL